MNSPVNTALIEQQIERSRLELLDMGLRGNPQLNCRSGSLKVLDIVDERSADVFELLVNQEIKMSFLPIPAIYQNEKNKDEQSTAITYQKETPALPPLDVYLAQHSGEARFADSHLQTGLIPEKLDKTLLRIEAEARNLMLEQGIDVLYLALGFLKWYEDGQSQSARYAPLVLVPVELLRSSSRDGFKIKYTGEDIGPNLTLAAKLQGEYNLQLPLFETEINPADYYHALKECVTKQKRWEVVTDKIALGLFSFGKFQMYTDLAPSSWPEHSPLAQKPLLQRLINTGFAHSAAAITQIHAHPNIQTPEQLPLVKDADSSQLEAILAAQQGTDLIIQGPPGTGKSQTITNIIAEFVGRGKKVLFVAQKLAALEVVKKRLDDCHLGHAVLELHSHKSTKKAVLASLSAAIEQGKPNIPNREADYTQLKKTREYLAAYINAITQPLLNSGLSYTAALGLLQRVKNEIATLPLPPTTAANATQELRFETIKQWNAAEFNHALNCVESLINHLNTMGTPAASAFRFTPRTEITPSEQQSLALEAERCIQPFTQLIHHNLQLAQNTQLPAVNTLQGITTHLQAFAMVLSAPPLQGIALNAEYWQANNPLITEALMAGKAMAATFQKYKNTFIAQAFSANLLPIRQGLMNNRDSWWRLLASDYRQAKQQLAALCREPLNGTITEWLTWVDELLDYQQNNTLITQHQALLTRVFGEQFQGANSHWAALEQAATWLTQFHRAIAAQQIPAEAIALIGQLTPPQIAHYETCQTLNTQFIAQWQALLNLLACNTQALANLNNTPFDELQTLLHRWQEANGLFQYTRYNQLTASLNNLQLNAISELSYTWQGNAAYLNAALKHCYYQGLVDFAYSNNPEVAQFDRLAHEKLINDFKNLDASSLGFAQEQLALTIYNNLPNRHAKGEIEILMREIGKKSRHLPIRQLIAKAGNAIQQIKPIFMMSPISIATYLAQGAIDFDLVIFDEASQIPAPDALGALMRGKQVIVVGDSQQMPPSDLFGKTVELADDDIENTTTAEMESILSLMEAKGTPQIMLRWHYRSRNDSLIAVSNDQFYNNRLLAFPCSGTQTDAKGLRFHHLPHTFYSEDGTATNLGEAQEIAKAVMQHAITKPHLSLGVVAFGIAQRELIALEVERLRRENPACEAFFQRQTGDEFFIKNLENVQGDERDAIFISVCYGKKSDGKIYQNFGLINKAGGERRLNVLISRARLSMDVFANFTADELRVDEQSPLGVQALQVFLRYAQTNRFERKNAVPTPTHNAFEQELHRAIAALGHPVKQHIGHQGFRLDIAIADAQNDARYILAIETDGQSYQEAASVRDRDRLRPSVLAGLGWRQYRVWSADWHRDANQELTRIQNAINHATAQQIAADQQHPKPQNLHPAQNKTPKPQTATAPHTAATITIERDEDVEENTTQAPDYKMLSNSALGLPHVDDFGAIATPVLMNAIRLLAEAEGPITPTFLTTRLAIAAGLTRTGARIKQQVEAAIHSAIHQGLVLQKDDALYGTQPKNLCLRNWGALPDAFKKWDYISDAELINALLLTLQQAHSITEKDAIAATATALGFKRCTTAITQKMAAIIQQQLQENTINLIDDRLRLTSE